MMIIHHHDHNQMVRILYCRLVPGLRAAPVWTEEETGQCHLAYDHLYDCDDDLDDYDDDYDVDDDDND